MLHQAPALPEQTLMAVMALPGIRRAIARVSGHWPTLAAKVCRAPWAASRPSGLIAGPGVLAFGGRAGGNLLARSEQARCRWGKVTRSVCEAMVSYGSTTTLG